MFWVLLLGSPRWGAREGCRSLDACAFSNRDIAIHGYILKCVNALTGLGAANLQGVESLTRTEPEQYARHFAAAAQLRSSGQESR